MSEINARKGGAWVATPDGQDWTDLGWTDTDGLTFEPASTVTVELSDDFAALCGTRTLTGGVVDANGMVRFDRPGGAVWISRDALNIDKEK